MINGISRDPKKLLRYFSGTAIFTSLFKLFAAFVIFTVVFHIRTVLYLNDFGPGVVKSVLFAGTSSLLYCYKLLMCLNNDRYTQSDFT